MELNYENYLQLKAEKLLRVQIAERFGIPDWKLKKHIANNGWGKKAPTLDHSSFSSYSKESAYWAGFIAADGNVDDKSRIRLMLKHDDLRHLQKYNTFLKSTYAIQENTTKYNRCAVEYTSYQIRSELESKYNIVPVKSLIIQPPTQLPEELIAHFIRGYFDGDGSVCESFSNRNSSTATFYATLVSGSLPFVKWLEAYLDLIGVTYNTQYWENKSQIKLNTNQAIKFLNSIYLESTEDTRLDRKYEIFKKVVIEHNRLTR